ncbi:MAG: glucosamine-6-phosphate deaminase [Bacilli bacterium]|nr:glucosamine-6-phosphate deaminase [Bacilli bacterium]
MKVIIGNFEKISSLIAAEFIQQIRQKPNSVLGLATGTSPLGVYTNLIEAYKKGLVSFEKVVTFNLDEYVGLDGNHHQSYRYFMNDNLFNHINIDKNKTHVLLGVGDYLAYAKSYDQEIANYGGIDLQILGLGSDGHIAFNEPNTPFDSLTHIAELTDSTIKDNSRLFNDISEVPTKAVTMGLKSIMNAKKIVLIATGKNKAKAIKDLLKGPISESVPSSILQRHPDCTIYVDDDAYSLIK